LATSPLIKSDKSPSANFQDVLDSASTSLNPVETSAMADPAFAEMEAEVETYNPNLNYRSNRADKFDQEPPISATEAETSPLLGPPALSDQATMKRWYNTPSVRSLA